MPASRARYIATCRGQAMFLSRDGPASILRDTRKRCSTFPESSSNNPSASPGGSASASRTTGRVSGPGNVFASDSSRLMSPSIERRPPPCRVSQSNTAGSTAIFRSPQTVTATARRLLTLRAGMPTTRPPINRPASRADTFHPAGPVLAVTMFALRRAWRWSMMWATSSDAAGGRCCKSSRTNKSACNSSRTRARRSIGGISNSRPNSAAASVTTDPELPAISPPERRSSR